jgi:hypothetical protein
MTAGRGIEGAGEHERLMDAEDPNDDLRLWLITLGGFIGFAVIFGVLGADGRGDSAAR